MKDKHTITVHFAPGPAAGMLEEITASYTSYNEEMVHVEHNRIHVPRAAGSGFIECRELFEGMYCMMLDIAGRHPVVMKCQGMKEDRYYLIGCRYGYQQSYFNNAESTAKHIRIGNDCIFVHSTRLESSLHFPAGQRHRVFMIIVSRQFALEELRLTGHSSTQSLIQDQVNGQPFSSMMALPLVVRHRIDQIFEQPDTNGHADFVHRSAMISAAYYLMNQWYLQFFNGREQQEPHYPASLQDVIKVKDLYIRDFESPPMTVEELARMCNMSVTKFKSVFKSLFGMSCYQYYQAQRMEYAKELLSKRRYPVKEVSYLTGFQNTANFTRSFKKAFDILPREFKNKNRE